MLLHYRLLPGRKKYIFLRTQILHETNEPGGLVIARVFPSRTEFIPTDKHAYFDVPGYLTPQYDEIHISTTFTWDVPHANWLAQQWMKHGKIILGGPAFNDPCNGEFEPGKYIRLGCVFTSRGCPNHCWYCLVPKREGAIRELKIHDGNFIMDNNLLACSEKHLSEVFKMLSDKRGINFNQGLEAKRITKDIGFELQKLKYKVIWLAYDRPGDYYQVLRAYVRLGKPKHKTYCYVLSGYRGDTPQKAEDRCMKLAKAGIYPFMMLYQPAKLTGRTGWNQPNQPDEPDGKTRYSKEWRNLQRKWTRPAAWKSFMNPKPNINKELNFR